jgi:ribonuclease-3
MEMAGRHPLQPLLLDHPIAVAVERDALFAALGHSFARPDLLDQALVHPSAQSGHAVSPFERLEFLGDRVVSLVVADMLYRLYGEDKEGDLARRHAALVSRDSLAVIAREIGLGAQVRLPSSDAGADARERPTILADALESVIGAVYLDAGFDVAAQVVSRLWHRPVAAVQPQRDAKTELQEWAQARSLALPKYRTVRAEGPDHAPEFTIEVKVGKLKPARAKGPSKRAAEQAAARALLERIAGAPVEDSSK